MAQVFEKVVKSLMVISMKIESTMRCHLMSIRMAAIEKSKDRTVVNLSGRMLECLPSMVMALDLTPEPRKCQKEKLLVRL